MTVEGQAVEGREFKDRKVGLVIVGALQIVLAGFCALGCAGMAIGMLAMRAHGGETVPISLRMMIPGMVFYVLLGTWFLVMGIGSIQARRWARALNLVAAWFWLLSGALGLLFMVLFMGDLPTQTAGGQQIPPQVAVALKVGILVFSGIFYVALPGALVLFYRSPHVKATCEFRNPQPSWTDRVPLPVLAMTLLFGLGAPCMFLMGFYGWTVPFFGVVLSGWAAAAVVLLSACLWGYIAWGSYRLNIAAWWLALVGSLLWTVSAGITFMRVGIMEFQQRMYRGVAMPAQQMEVMRETVQRMQGVFPVITALWALVIVAYLIWVRRYFVAAQGRGFNGNMSEHGTAE